MALVSNFVPFGFAFVDLQIGTAKTQETYEFTLPNNLDLNSDAVLTMVIDVNSPNGLRWNASFNGRTNTLFEFTHNDDRFCSIHEALSGSNLQVGANTVTVSVVDGTGQLRVRDLVLHHRVNV